MVILHPISYLSKKFCFSLDGAENCDFLGKMPYTGLYSEKWRVFRADNFCDLIQMCAIFNVY